MTTYQWLALFVAWLGWVFDVMDVTIYAIVLHPALHELPQAGAPGAEITSKQIGWYGGIVFSIFLMGWLAGCADGASREHHRVDLSGGLGHTSVCHGNQRQTVTGVRLNDYLIEASRNLL